MLPQPGVTAAATRLPIDIRRFPWIKRLAADYVFDFGRVAAFFTGNPADPAAWSDAVTRAQAHPRDRSALVALLHRQQHLRGAPPEAVAAAARLEDPRSVAVVTGQQASLFGGPVYTLLKALTAIRLAGRLQADHGIPAVAVFWVESEDHDWNEVRSCGILDAQAALHHVSLGDPPGAGSLAVARVRLDQAAVRAIDEVEALLQATEFTAGLLEALRRAYRPGAGMSEAFGIWLESLLGPRGLVVHDASDPAAKRIVRGVFAREIEAAGMTARLAVEAGAALQACGYHAQAAPAEGTLALFHLSGRREPIRRDGAAFLVGGAAMSAEDLLVRLEQAPVEFSPSVLLRPLVQDTLFPTACYVAGPNELGYLAQLRRVYEAFGVPMPLIHPRTTATILDGSAMRFLARTAIPFEALRAQDESVLNALLESQLPPGVDAAFRDALVAIETQMARLGAEAARVDATLEGASRSTLGRMQEDLRKLHAKIVQAAKRKDETLRRQFRHAQAQAFPSGRSQERAVGFITFLNRYGAVLVDRLLEDVPVDPGTHWVISL